MPTVVPMAAASSRLAQEEVFGPVGAVLGFATDQEAVAIADDSRYPARTCASRAPC
jgi:acyl-CoA reductase-like NAD-dependent aldehyde dehydrogenase